MKDISNRRGTFQIDCKLFDDIPHLVRQVLGHFLIVRAESLFAEDVITYTAFSEEFDKLGPGEITPKYVLTTFEFDGELIDIEVTRE